MEDLTVAHTVRKVSVCNGTGIFIFVFVEKSPKSDHTLRHKNVVHTQSTICCNSYIPLCRLQSIV